MTLKHNISKTSTIGFHSWTCVGGCKSMWKVCYCGTIVSNSKALQKSKNNSFKMCEPIWVGILPLFWMRVTFVIWRWFEWRFNQKFNPNLISKLLPLKTIIDIPIIISYITKLQQLKFGLWIVTSNLQTSIQLDLSKKNKQTKQNKTLDLQLWLLKSRSCFLDEFEGNWVWGFRSWKQLILCVALSTK